MHTLSTRGHHNAPNCWHKGGKVCKSGADKGQNFSFGTCELVDKKTAHDGQIQELAC